MCGIFACFKNNSLIYDFEKFKKDNFLLNHRGPDDSGVEYFSINQNTIFLGHNRLTIQDISKNGSQPMSSFTKRYKIIFNGEIYNHNELRRIIDKKIRINWKSTSDTETLINLFEIYNNDLLKFFNLLEGQFAFLIYDLKNKEIIIARDKSGEKPLYFTTNENFFAVASDLKPISKIPSFNKNISDLSLKKYLQYNYVPSPYSIFQGSHKLPSASYIKIDLKNYQNYFYNNFNDFISNKHVEFKKWWSLNKYKNDKIIANTKPKSFLETKKSIDLKLTESVKRQLISDAPLGAFLSSGIDSTLIVAIMKKLNTNTKTFSIGFNFSDYDESEDSKNISNYFNTNHHQYIFTEKDAQNVIPKLHDAFSEPFADSSQIPTMLLSKFASNYVKVALSGDGGDELFGGYNRYLLGLKYEKYSKFLPNSIKNFSLYISNLIPKEILKLLYKYSIKQEDNINLDNHKIEKIRDKIKSINNNYTFYQSMITEFNNMNILNFHIQENKTESDELFNKNSYLNFHEAMMHRDFENYLSDDILCKVDRSSMYSSLETRCPYLSTDVIYNSYIMHPKFKINQSTSKFLLKEILNDYIPKKYFNKEKKGFAVPISIWMRNHLKEWTNDLLSESILNKHNYFNIELVNLIKKQHYKKQLNHENKLWSILQFNQWYTNFFNI